MINLTKTIVLTTLVLLISISNVQAEPLKLSHQWPRGDGRDVGARAFAEEVNRLDSSLKFRIYPGASLISSPVGQLDALQKGSIQLSVFPLIYGVGKIPELSVTILPGAVNGVEAAMDLEKSEYRDQLQTLAERNGFHILTWWWTEGGIANQERAITGPDSVNGLKMRGADRTIDTVLSSAGASVISMPSTELYSALQTGVLDGLMTSYESLLSMRLYEQTKYATLGGDYTIFVLLQPLVVSMQTWNKLTPKQKEIFEKAADNTNAPFLKEQLLIKKEAVDKFKNAGVEVREMKKDEFNEWLDLAKQTSWVEFYNISPDAKMLIDALDKSQSK
ncbi:MULTISPECIES: TRAP transporter substrate-binding protein DctP [unclassified Marinobacter]|jgi:TRAP-type C4-dicarboxylate transport system substrate-binding protein|uniref:TRAP transporter substrate-binding protein DctP n=1 Tax=unclassified Marinobacter TaxID=83889 RepID=UPI002010ACFF|nr:MULTISPECIES: TRAP transporter substrate-binding protein DctP [unclassified Marinobacter]UQG55144.1 TRAP transporter substrate-binding protein DctP [Marinobacter sp. M4C]UQG63946.1 TRAP transporter substrate-binding protein DctP [Marinobacter sp. M2C]UQG68229.1 TRAP transporter substrate-binding protein DctP [Marinobacter sp. M1C]